ncbi:MAG: amylo-alpha-1,6-glucosidase [Dysgonamonadaceae bacterium]|jgi:predicted glycogen debranching enzyme|nr:amylo-alpha-1,6-glucosidase [Dysgonamonadaceae bacterium]
MGYLNFDKTLLINLEESLQREILRTNRGGAYHAGTIVDCNTRKYHGLLVMPVPALDEDNHVILSSLDATVIQHGAEFNLGLHRYDNNHFSPNGHKYIREYDVATNARALFRVGGVILSKEQLFSTFENRILIKYSLLDAHSPTILRFKPFLAFRNVNELTFENEHVNKNYTEVANGIKTRMYEGYPDLYMQFSKPPAFVFQPVWNKNIEYSKEMERGYPYREDLYVPGYFELEIEKGESVYFSGGDTLIDPSVLAEKFREEQQRRTPRNSFYNCLKNAAQQFYFRPNEEDAYLIAGYPWFKVRARDLFIALPGCTLSIDDPARFEKIAGTAVSALRRFMKNGATDRVITGIDLPDVLLWASWAFQQYAEAYGVEKCNALYGKIIQDMIDYIKAGKHPNLLPDESGLLRCDGKEKAVTWMNSTSAGKPIVPRSGYIVELNALWYNLLKFGAELAEQTGNAKRAAALEEAAGATGQVFAGTFVNEYGYLFDYIDGSQANWSVRPNMLFAVSLHYSPLDRRQKRAVLNIVTKELLTPKGIRSLSPKSEGYRPYYVGTQEERDLAYHQGTAWSWLLGAYLEAYLRLYRTSGISFVERMLIGLDDEMGRHCIGTISELFDGNPPFQSRGAISFAMNVAEILRVLKLLDASPLPSPKEEEKEYHNRHCESKV